MPSTVRTVSASRVIVPGSPLRSETTWTSGGGWAPDHGELDDAPPGACHGVDDHRTALGHRAAQGGERLARAILSAICRDSSKRCSTASTTSSTEQAQIESWAELRITPSQASSRRRSGHRSGGREEGGERLGPALEGRARSTPRPASRRPGSRRRPSGRWPGPRSAARPASAPGPRSARWPGTRQRGDLEAVVVLDGVGLGHRPGRGRAGAAGGRSRS